MPEPSTDGISLLDPFGFWKTARDANLEAWSKLMIDIVNSDEYAQATGVALEQTLATSQPVRDAIEKVMTQTLGMLNMPSRAEVVSLAERLTNVEMRLDDMDFKLNAIRDTIVDTVKEVVRESAANQNRHLREIKAQLDTTDAKYDTISEVVKDAVRSALETPSRHIREIEAELGEVEDKVSAMQTSVATAARPAPARVEAKVEPKPEAKAEAKTEAKPAPKAEAKPTPKAEAKPAAAAKKEEAK